MRHTDNYISKLELGFTIEELNCNINENPDLHYGYFLRAQYFFNCSEYQKAISDISQAIKLEPDKCWYYYLRGFAEMKNQLRISNPFEPQLEKVKSDFCKAIAITSNFLPAIFQLGEIARVERNWDSAINKYNQCLEIDISFNCYYELWMCYMSQQKTKDSRKILERLIQNHPESLEYYYYMGLTCFKEKNTSIALKYFNIYIDRKNILTEEEKENYQILLISKFEKVLLKAENLLKTGNYKSAQKIYNECIDKNLILNGKHYFNYISTILGRYFEEYDDYQYYIYNLLDPFKNHISIDIEYLSGHSTLYTEYSKLNFGVFKGRYIKDICTFDPKYIIWCAINVNKFIIENHLLINKEFINLPNFDIAIKHNLIKYELVWLPYFNCNEDSVPIIYTLEESSRFDVYGGPNGYDDDTIDSAFSGCPDAVWNVD